MWEIYFWWNSNKFMTTNQIRKIKKNMKKSFKKADKIRKIWKKLDNIISKEADEFLDNELKKI